VAITTSNRNKRIEESLFKTVRTGFTGNVETDSDAKNQCKRPSFNVLAKDTHPPTGLAHIPVLVQQWKFPALLVPGKASVELGVGSSVEFPNDINTDV
jgi:hypothetical protein